MKFFRFFIFFISFLAVAGNSIEEKKKQSIDLLNKAEKFFLRSDMSVTKACYAFVNNKKWKVDDITIWLWESEGARLLTVDYGLIWTKKEEFVTDFFGHSLMEVVVNAGQKGDWVIYPALESYRFLYVKTVQKEGKIYILSTGFFSETPELLCPGLVKGVKYRWNDFEEISELFQIVNNREGPFVIGSMYVTIMDDVGRCWANGKDSLLVGKNLLDKKFEWHDVYQEVLNAAKKRESGWIDVKYQGLKNKVYFQSVKLSDGSTNFVLMSGYFPQVNVDFVKSVGNKVVKLIDKRGLDPIVKDFNTYGKLIRELTYGHIKILLMDFSGKVLAYTSSQDISLIGSNMFNYVDEKNRPVMKFVENEVSKRGEAWVTRFHKGAIERIYGRKAKTKDRDIIVVVMGFYPHEKEEIAKIFVDDVTDSFKLGGNSLKLLKSFSNFDSAYLRGDVGITIYDEYGICWVDGPVEKSIWKKSEAIANSFSKFKKYDRFELEGKRYYCKIVQDLMPKIKGKWLVCSNY